MRAVLTVIGKDQIGITHAVTSVLAKYQVNILDISQTILQGLFSMIMIVDLEKCGVKFEEVQEALEEKGREFNLSVRLQHEDIFKSMNQI